MAALTALSCLAASLTAGVVGLLDAGIRAEGRSRQGTGGSITEAEAVPLVGAGLAEREGEAMLLYVPRLLVQQGVEGTAVLHRLNLEGALRPSRRWVLRLAASGHAGTTDLLLDQGHDTTSGGPVQRVPASSRLQVASASLGLSAEGAVARGVRSRFSVSAWTDGGRTAEAEARLPRQRALRATGYAELARSRHDVLAAELQLSGTRVRPAEVDWISGLQLSWRRRLEDRPEPRTPEQVLADPDPAPRPRELPELPEVWVGLGAAVDALWRRAPESVRWRVYPSAEVGYRRQLGGTVEASLVTSLRPTPDRYGGRTIPRADGGGRLTWRPRREWNIGADATLGLVVDGASRGESVAGGGLSIARSIGTGWDLSAGSRGWRQQRAGEPTVHYTWTFLALSYRERQL